LNGLLYQLSSLSSIADELFQSVLDSSKETFTRISNISTRLKTVNDKLDSIDSYISNNTSKFYGNHAYQLSETAVAFLSKKNEQNIKKSNLPPALNWQYEKNCQSVPNFGDLDQYHEKKSCIKDYSDPGYFFEAWAVAELEKVRKLFFNILKARQKEEKKKEKKEKSC
jgi:hypothetical protein